MPLEVIVSLELKIRFKMLKIAKKIKDLRAAFIKKFEEFMSKQDESLRPRLISTSACLVGTSAIVAHNLSVSLNTSGRTMGIRKLAGISIISGILFSYIWWRLPGSAEQLSGEDVDTVFSIVRESRHAPSERMRPMVDFLHAGVFQSGMYQPIDWDYEEEVEEEEDEYVHGYEQFVHDKSKLPKEQSYSNTMDSRSSEQIPRYNRVSEGVRPTQSLRNLRPVVKNPDDFKVAKNGAVLTSLLNTASTADRRIDLHSTKSAEDLPFDWIGGN